MAVRGRSKAACGAVRRYGWGPGSGWFPPHAARTPGLFRRRVRAGRTRFSQAHFRSTHSTSPCGNPVIFLLRVRAVVILVQCSFAVCGAAAVLRETSRRCVAQQKRRAALCGDMAGGPGAGGSRRPPVRPLFHLSRRRLPPAKDAVSRRDALPGQARYFVGAAMRPPYVKKINLSAGKTPFIPIPSML